MTVGCYGYRYGAPIEACSHMFPTEHGYDARNDDPPFTITVDKNRYSPNEAITVTIDSNPTDPDDATREWFMEGILVQARKADCTSSVPVGTFEVPECDNFLQVIDCLGVKNNAVRHYTHLHIYNKTFTWKAPDQAAGHVYIVATIARNRERFWMNVQSETIMDISDTSVVTQSCEAAQYTYVRDSAGLVSVSVSTVILALFGILILL